MKNQIVTAVEPVFLSPLVDQLTDFGQVSVLTVLHHIFTSYGVIDKFYLEENAVDTMGPYDRDELLSQLIKQLEKGRELARSGDQKISDAMMMSKGSTLLAQTGFFNNYIREWRRKYADLKTWVEYNYFSHQADQEQKRAVTITGEGGYTATVQNIYHAPPRSPE